MKLSKFWESAWFYRLLALLLAVGLFAYVNAEDLNSLSPSSRSNNAITATTERTLKVPLSLKADTDKYFITGYPEKVAVTLSGSTSLVTMTANTMNFRVIADLSELGVGKHTVHLREEGLNKDLTYSLKPKTIQVTIQDRKTKTMPIQVKYNPNSLAPGYTAGTAKLNTETAQVTGGKGEINRVYQIVANLVLSRDTKDAVDQEVLLQALDSDGNTVNVVVSPQTVHVSLPVRLPSKRVSVKLQQSGAGVTGLRYTLKASASRVTIYGAQDVIDQIDSLEVPVSISGVTSSTTKTIRLLDDNSKLVATDPKTLKVTIGVTQDAKADGEIVPDQSSTTESSSSRASNASSTSSAADESSASSSSSAD
ncbi:CdaR family protein [Lacticaseibacillus absianus]|uniref:CdaR family protein n=1 Tax=Lacticaseibacillus absianus TaxID=2729623 RepID=UPI0015C69D8B|nr:CdaR family protein [Lacticaseibacillus absianus]